MAFGIYKAGQGYWVRVLTAIGAGMIVLAAGGWAWQQIGAVRLPVAFYEVPFFAVQGELQPGDTVRLMAPDDAGRLVEVGSGVAADTVSATGERGRIRNMELVPGAELRRIAEVRSTDTNGAFVGDVSGTIRGEPIVNTVTLQTIALGAILLIGALIVYYFVGVKKRTSEFLIATDGEMKKVNWSTRKEVIGSTWVVVAASFLISAFLFVIDLGFSQFFQFVGVLER